MRKNFYVLLLLFGSMVLADDLYAKSGSKDSGSAKDRESEKISKPSKETYPNTGALYKFSGEKYDTGWAFYFDNDALSLLNVDQDYTTGLALTLSGRRATEYFFSIDKPLKLIDKLTMYEKVYKRKGSFQLHNMEFGLTAFTPDDIETSEPIEDDHPYASLLFMVNTQQTVIPQHNASYESRLTIGILGLRLAEWLQTEFHEAMGQQEPNGWRHQISDGGEPTAKYAVSGQWTLARNYNLKGFGYELKSSAEASAGYLTGLNVGISGRLGKINTPWWSFNPHQAEYIHLGTPIVTPTNKSQSKEIYLFGGVNIRYVAYNAILQGQFRDSEVTFSRSELEPFIGEAFIGILKQFPYGISLSFIIRGRTEAIKGSNARRPIWGGLIISRAY